MLLSPSIWCTAPMVKTIQNVHAWRIIDAQNIFQSHTKNRLHLVVLALLRSQRRNGGERRPLWWSDAAPDVVTVWPDASGQFSAAVRRVSVRVSNRRVWSLKEPKHPVRHPEGQRVRSRAIGRVRSRWELSRLRPDAGCSASGQTLERVRSRQRLLLTWTVFACPVVTEHVRSPWPVRPVSTFCTVSSGNG
jgi:hypothetical protein